MDWGLSKLKGRLSVLAATAMQAMNLGEPEVDPMIAEYTPAPKVRSVAQPINIYPVDTPDEDTGPSRPKLLTAEDLAPPIRYEAMADDAAEYGPSAVIGV